MNRVLFSRDACSASAMASALLCAANGSIALILP
jgi:hypothetical protein